MVFFRKKGIFLVGVYEYGILLVVFNSFFKERLRLFFYKRNKSCW